MNIQKIIKTIKSHCSFLISTHVNPDPDGLCSELALADFLKRMGKKVIIVNEEPVPQRYRFLPGAKQIRGYNKNLKFNAEVAIIVDCGDLNRIGLVKQLVGPGIVLVNIDHHITNDRFGAFNLVRPDASSTAEVLFDVLKRLPVKFSSKTALNLYAGIMTDTGCFRYENTLPRTLQIAGELRKFSFNAYQLYQRLYEVIPLKDKGILTILLSKAKIYYDRVVCVELTAKTTKGFSDQFDLKDAIFKFFRSFDGAEVFVILTEVKKGVTRVNFRSSQDFDVASLANQFGGGGHRKASGCVVNDSLSNSKRKILKAIRGLL